MHRDLGRPQKRGAIKARPAAVSVGQDLGGEAVLGDRSDDADVQTPGDLARPEAAVTYQQDAEAVAATEHLRDDVDSGPGVRDLAQRGPHHEHDRGRLGQHAGRLAGPGVQPAAVGEHVRAQPGKADCDTGPERRKAERLPRIRYPGQKLSPAGVVQRDQLAAELGRHCRRASASLERDAEQPAGSSQVPGIEAGDDVATAGVALGYHDRAWPGQRHGKGRGRHPRRAARRGQGVDGHQRARLVMMRATCPVDA